MEVVCEPLYNKLKRMFGEVIIANNLEGLQMQMMGAVGERGRPQVINSGEYYRVNCMFCRDTRKRLWVNHRFGEFKWLCHCFNDTHCMAGQEGRARRDRLHFLLFETNRPVVLPTAASTQLDETEVGPISLPGPVTPLDHLAPNHIARAYLERRGFDAEYLSREFGIGYIDRVDDPSQYRLLEGRIFIPVIMNGDVVGWQGRWPEDLKWKDVRITKYYNLRGMPKRRMFYNYDSARRFKTVVVCEGVSDVWAVGPRGVSILGSELTQWQRGQLAVDWRGGTCVIYLDGDAAENNEVMTREMRNTFEQAGGRVLSVRLPPDRDPGDLSYEANWDIIRAEADRQGVVMDMSYN